MTPSARLARLWFFAVVLGIAALFATFSHAATLACTVGNKTASLTISAANANRMVAWANAVYATIPNPDQSPGAPATIPNPNPDPVLSALNGVLLGLRNNVISWEREQAVTAVPQPAPIN